MNQFVPQTGGHRLFLEDFVLLQQAFTEAIGGMATALYPTGTVILSGLKYSRTGSNVTITSGYASVNGEVLSFAGSTFPFQPTPAAIFMRIHQTKITPPDPVQYKDTINKNVHFNRILIAKYFNDPANTTIDDVVSTSVTPVATDDVDGVNGAYYDNMCPGGVLTSGIVVEFYPDYVGEENVVFDSTGLGIGRMRGFALCNGLNNTPDLRGQFTIMPSNGVMNSAALISGVVDGVNIRNQLGAKTKTILQDNLPDYELVVDESPHVHFTVFSGADNADLSSSNSIQTESTYGGNSLHYLLKGTPNTPNIGVTSPASTNLTVSSNGGGVMLNVVPPCYSMLKLKRII